VRGYYAVKKECGEIRMQFRSPNGHGYMVRPGGKTPKSGGRFSPTVLSTPLETGGHVCSI
jgi:hypothetical protein